MDSAQLAITHLLVVAEDTPTANRLISHLRQDRFALRAENVLDEQALADLVTQDQWDVLVCYDNGKVPLPNILTLLEKHEQDFPVILVTTKPVPADPLTLYRLGVNDVVPEERMPYLSLSVQRAATQYLKTRRLRRQEVLYRELEKRHEALLNASTTPVGYVQEGVHLYCNQEYANFLGYDDAEAVKARPFLNLFATGERERIRALLRQVLVADTTTTAQVLKADGSELPAQLLLVPVDYHGRACLQVSFSAAAGNPAYSEAVAQINNQDLVTKVANRAHFRLQLETAIRKAVQLGSFSTLLLVQLDEFAEVAAVIGKATTNLLLNDVSQYLQGVAGGFDKVGRLDEGSFGVLMGLRSADDALQQADALKERVNALVAGYLPPSLSLECHVGVALINGHALDADTIVQRAQQSLSGGALSTDSRLEIQIGDTAAPNAGEMLDYLAIALGERRFVLNYQPFVPIKGGSNQGYEVLIRMLDEQGNEVPPMSFLPLAIVNGMGEAIDRLVVSLLINSKEVASNDDSLLLHLTSNTLASKTFLPWLHGQLLEARFPPERLVLYLSEIDIHTAYDAACDFSRLARELGITIAISHFGSAIEPFSIFQHMQPTFVSLDESVVRDIVYSQHQKNSVRSLIDALHQRGIKVAAPHVEDMDVLPVLWSIGADFVQGYCLQAPTKSMNYAFVQEEEITLSAPAQ